MKSTFPPPDQEIIELLGKLAALNAEYPPELLAARRAAFSSQIEKQKTVGASKEESFSQERVIEILESLKPATFEYPPELLSARRAAFISQIEKHKTVGVPKKESLSPERIVEILERLKPATPEYPPELLSARRAAFLAQIEQYNQADVQEELSAHDPVLEFLGNLKQGTDEYPPELMAAKRSAFVAQIRQHNSLGEQEEQLVHHNGRLLKLLGHLKSIEIEYPLKLWTARRTAFLSQIRGGGMSVLEALRAAIQSLFSGKRRTVSRPTIDFRRTSMVIATFLVAVFMGSLLYGNRETFGGLGGSSLSQREGAHPGPVAASTSTDEVAQVICKPGYSPPLCLAKEFDKSSDLTFPGNGTARPAVAKDTIPGYSMIHQPAYVNDGLYGPGASWISNSAYSWLKIDLGEAKTINTITFGRDRLGRFNDGDPGQFFIAVALSDNVYADGNSSNDSVEYEEVYNSEETGFDGLVSGPETVTASFEPVTARFVKITFENARTAVDEVEVFMIQPPGFADNPTQRPREDEPRSTFTAVPTNTLVPTITSTAAPTNTPVPTFTNTPRPTNTPVPTLTNTPRPPNTPTDKPTNTPVPPTDTPEPPPTDTPEPPPTDTPVPAPTDTSEPAPTDSPEPFAVPTETPMEILGF